MLHCIPFHFQLSCALYSSCSRSGGPYLYDKSWHQTGQTAADGCIYSIGCIHAINLNQSISESSPPCCRGECPPPPSQYVVEWGRSRRENPLPRPASNKQCAVPFSKLLHQEVYVVLIPAYTDDYSRQDSGLYCCKTKVAATASGKRPS